MDRQVTWMSRNISSVLITYAVETALLNNLWINKNKEHFISKYVVERLEDYDTVAN